MRGLCRGLVRGVGWIDIVHKLRRGDFAGEHGRDRLHRLQRRYISVEFRCDCVRELLSGQVLGRRRERVQRMRCWEVPRERGIDGLRELPLGIVLGRKRELVHILLVGNVSGECGGFGVQ